MIKHISTTKAREGKEPEECQTLMILFGNTKFRLSVEFGELVINKFHIDDSRLVIHPVAINEIRVT